MVDQPNLTEGDHRDAIVVTDQDTGQDLDRVPDQGEDHDPVLDVGADVPGAGPTVDPGQGAGATVKVLVGVDHEASRPPDLQNGLTMCSEKKIEPVHYSKSLLALTETKSSFSLDILPFIKGVYKLLVCRSLLVLCSSSIAVVLCSCSIVQ